MSDFEIDETSLLSLVEQLDLSDEVLMTRSYDFDVCISFQSISLWFLITLDFGG